LPTPRRDIPPHQRMWNKVISVIRELAERKYNLATQISTYETSPGIKAVDVASSKSSNGSQITFTIVNRDIQHAVKTTIHVTNPGAIGKKATLKQITYTGKTLYGVNSAATENTMIKTQVIKRADLANFTVLLSPASFTIITLSAND